MRRDPYKVLRLDPARTHDGASIKAAFRKMAAKHHPDVNPGDEKAADRFKAAVAARDQLLAALSAPPAVPDATVMWTPPQQPPPLLPCPFCGGPLAYVEKGRVVQLQGVRFNAGTRYCQACFRFRPPSAPAGVWLWPDARISNARYCGPGKGEVNRELTFAERNAFLGEG